MTNFSIANPRQILNSTLGILGRLPVQPEVRILSGRCGLFSDVFMALNSIQICKEYKLSGHVYWGRRSLYFDPELTGNAYKYFFLRNGCFSFSERRVLKGISFSPYPPSGDGYSPSAGQNPRRYMKQLIDTYAAPRAEVLEQVEGFQQSQLPTRNVIGVHVRRTDVLTGSEERRTQPVYNFVQAVEGWLTQHSDGRAFLATDDSAVVAEFQARFGNRLRYQDAVRSSDGRSIHGHYDGGLNVSPNQKGREALVDALILSKCRFLIRCFSFLTNYSLCINPDSKFLDLDKQNLGVVRTPWIHK